MDIGESATIGQESMNITEVPNQLRYSNLQKVGAPIAERQQVTLLSSNGQIFGPGQEVRVPFNVATDSFVDLKNAYLRFDIVNLSNDLCYLDASCGGAAFLETVRVYDGTSNLLTETIQYPVIYSAQVDLLSDNHRQSTLSMMDRSSEYSLTEAIGNSDGITGTGISNLSNTHAARGTGGDVTNLDYRTSLYPTGAGGREKVTVSHVLMDGFFQSDRLIPLGYTQGTAYMTFLTPQVNNPMVRLKQLTINTPQITTKNLVASTNTDTSYVLANPTGVVVGMTAKSSTVTDAVVTTVVGSLVILDKTLGITTVNSTITFEKVTITTEKTIYLVNVTGLKEGMQVTGANIPVKSFIESIDSTRSSITLNNGVTGSIAVGSTITFGSTDTTSLNWQLENVQLVVPIIRMTSDYSAQFRQILASGIPISWNTQIFHNVQQTVPQGTRSSTSLTYATRKRSVKAVFNIFRKSKDLNNPLMDSNSCRRTCGISDYTVEIGGMSYPPKPIQIADNNLGVVYANLLSAMSNLGDTSNASSMNLANFRQPNSADTTCSSKIVYALELDTYGHSNVTSGRNLSMAGLPLVFRITFGDADNCAQINDSVISTLFCLSDGVCTLDGIAGTMSMSS